MFTGLIFGFEVFQGVLEKVELVDFSKKIFHVLKKTGYTNYFVEGGKEDFGHDTTEKDEKFQ